MSAAKAEENRLRREHTCSSLGDQDSSRDQAGTRPLDTASPVRCCTWTSIATGYIREARAAKRGCRCTCRGNRLLCHAQSRIFPGENTKLGRQCTCCMG